MRVVCVTRRFLALSLLYSEYLPTCKRGTMRTFSRCTEPLRESCKEAGRRNYGGDSRDSELFAASEFSVTTTSPQP